MIKEPKSPYNDRCKPSVPLLLIFPFSCLFPKNALFLPYFVKQREKLPTFANFSFETFGGYEKTPYLCTRFSEQSTRRERESDKDKRSLKRFT